MASPNGTKNVLRERYTFFQRCQMANETFHQFLEDVRHRAKFCEFQSLEESLVRDRLVFGINNDDLRVQLMNNGGDPPLNEIIEICGARKDPTVEDIALPPVEELIIKPESENAIKMECEDYWETMSVNDLEVDMAGGSSSDDDLSDSLDDKNWNSVEQSTNTILRCTICQKQFTESVQLNKHLIQVHGDLKTLKCGNCKQKFSSALYLRNHLLQYKTVVQISDADALEQSILGSKEPAHGCNICNAKYIFDSSLCRHLYQAHADTENMKCLHCNQEFAERDTFRGHMFSHRKSNEAEEITVADGDINPETESNPKTDHKSEKEPAYTCQICNAKYMFDTSISRHIYQVHADSEQMKCLHCDKRFKEKKRFRAHMFKHRLYNQPKEAASGENNSQTESNSVVYSCNICNTKYICHTSIGRHVYEVHADKANMSCLHCNQKFTELKAFRVHMGTHRSSSEVPKLAPAGGGNDSQARVILRSHLKDDKKAPYGCKICHVKYAFDTNISRHMYQVHADPTNMKCLHCDKQFAETRAFRVHMFKHRETNYSVGLQVDSKLDCKSFVCALCHKWCANRVSFIRHMYNCHAEMENWSCLNCNQQHDSLEELRTHMLLYKKSLPVKSSNGEIEIVGDTAASSSNDAMTEESGKTNSVDKESGDNVPNLSHLEGSTTDTPANSENKIRLEETVFECKICQWEFSNKYSIVKHILQFHCNKIKRRCNHCSEHFSSFEELRYHINVYVVEKMQTLERYMCKICDKTFIQMQNYERHVKCHSLNPQPDSSSTNVDTNFEMASDPKTQRPKSKTPIKCTYACKICQNEYPSDAGVNRHIYVTHADFDEKQCLNCNKRFPALEVLKKHMLGNNRARYRSNNGGEPAERLTDHCASKLKSEYNANDDENEQRNESNSVGHVQKSASDNITVHVYTCPICDKAYSGLDKLVFHRRRYHTDKKQLKCLACDIKFKTSKELQKHMGQEHPEKYDVARIDVNSVITAAAANVADAVESKSVTPHSSSQEQHGQTRTMHTCTICNTNLTSKQGAARHILSFHIDEPSLSCKGCSTIFKTMDGLKQHIEFHTQICQIPIENLNAIQCRLCERTFLAKCNYKQHMLEHLRTRSEPEGLVCDLCGKSFERHQKGHFNVHMENHRAIELEKANDVTRRRYQCYRCKKYVLTITKLKAHMAAHTRNELCYVCGAKFSRQDVLRKHLLTHNIGVKKPKKQYPCRDCDRSFLHPDSLTRHMAVHTGLRPYKCDECDKCYAVPVALKEHKLLKHSTSRYECSICSTGFKSQKALKRHRIVHTTEYPHKCQYCPREFRNNFNCRAHMRKQHNHIESRSRSKVIGDASNL